MIRLNSLFLMIMIFFSILVPSSAFSNTSIADEEKFASFLFSRGYYKEAVPGYLFLYYSSDSIKDKSEYAHMAGKCYLENGDFNEAEKLFRSFLGNDEISENLGELFYVDFSRSLYFQKKFDEIPYELEQIPFFRSSDKLKEITAWSYINTGNWDKAGLLFKNIDTENNNQRIAEINRQLENKPDFNEKSPLEAALLSALFPGAGHAYADNWTSAFGAFTANLVFGSLTAYSVYKKQWIYAAVFGVLEAGWYSGNIASAYQEAEIYNRNEENKFKLKLSVSFPIEFKILKH